MGWKVKGTLLDGAIILRIRSFLKVIAVFTGLDFVVVGLAVGLILYVVRPEGGGGGAVSKPEPLTLMVMVLVAGMIVLSLI